MPTVLYAEDDVAHRELMRITLNHTDITLVEATDGQEALQKIKHQHPDLILLDLFMPKLDGYQVCQRIREMADTPIIMLTAKGREEDIIKGLDVGADDYLTKPFRVGELLARVRATLRRARTMSSATVGDTVTYNDDYLSIDLDNHRVSIDNEPVKLTPTEYKLLAMLVKNKGRLLEFRQILENVWGFEYSDDVDYLRVYIWHLRRKLEPDPKNPIYFLNELNTGYRFEAQN